MARLRKEHKVFIINFLARYSSYDEVMLRFREKFGFGVSKRQVMLYNPETRSCTAGQELQELFYKERNSYENDVSDLPLSKRGYRIRELCETAAEAKEILNLSTDVKVRLAAIRTYAECIVKIDKLMEPNREKKPEDEMGIGPTLQQINNHIYFDR